jgi:hypothetical protein
MNSEPTETEIAELTELFPEVYPYLRKQIEKYRPKTKEDWDRFAEFHDNMIKNMESVVPTEHESEYFHFRMVKEEKD